MVTHYSKTYNKIRFLNTISLVECSDDQVMESASMFCKKYEADITCSLVNEVLCFRNAVIDKIQNRNFSVLTE